MKLQILPTMLQGVRMLPILYGVFGFFEGGAHSIQALRGEFALLIANSHESDLHESEHKAERGEAHLLHPQESHEPDAPESGERIRYRGIITRNDTSSVGTVKKCTAARTPLSISRAVIIFRNYTPPAPERSQTRVYFV